MQLRRHRCLYCGWQRPDQFHKVLSTVGSFTNIRGGHRYADIVRESEKKPLRVFFQDGRNDNRGERRGGNYDETWDWFKQNVRLVEAMTEKGYDINYSWSIGVHGLKSGGVILPEMMRGCGEIIPCLSTSRTKSNEPSTSRPIRRPARRRIRPAGYGNGNHGLRSNRDHQLLYM